MALSSLYRRSLEDQTAQPAFARAITSLVRPGDIVLDVGTGTGIHALLACRAGAARVYAVERENVIELARQTCARNGCGDRVCFVRGSIFEVELPERVDVAVCNMGLKELAQVMPSVAASFLKPGGKLIPFRADVLCAPVESAERAAEIASWGSRPLDFDFSIFLAATANSVLEQALQDTELLSPGQNFAALDFARDPGEMAAALSFRVARHGTMNGIGVWHVQHFADGISTTIGPPTRLSQVWGNQLLPLEQSFPVEAGDEVSIWLQTGTGGWGATWNWKVTVRDGGGNVRARTAQSTLFGDLHSKRALARTAPDFVPQLSSSGEAARLVLEGCAAGLAIAAIQRRLCARFPRLFPGGETAAAFVAEILEKYAP
ncbi:MAG TPA: 50S ribosomal protein L11 methyltransferase [Terriglobales bacterium]|nr:50S ribosomal protein L11 methyltransferase [Terriglobales bacterium]